VTERPYVVLSAAMSIDGYLDDASGKRLLLSNDADIDRVDAVRAASDAILVGATTIRRDNPRLTVRSLPRQEERLARGLPTSPMRVTLTGSGDLNPAARFFVPDGSQGLVYGTTSALNTARSRVATVATVIDGGDPLDLNRVLADLVSRDVHQLLVEGGGAVHTQFLTAGLADELQLVVAPFFVGDSRAPRLVSDGAFPWSFPHRAELAEVNQLGDVVVLRYALSDRFLIS
jgi:5-amino-6-(5-phosphoribosylamino)uracil reductase